MIARGSKLCSAIISPEIGFLETQSPRLKRRICVPPVETQASAAAK